MTFLKDVSIIWSLMHTLLIFMLLFESRYPKRKTIKLTLSAMIPLMIINFALSFIVGTEKYIMLMLATLSLPSFIFFWILAKHRDGRFVFTFCIVDTIVLEIIYITNIIDNYIPGYVFLFISRLIAYPLLEFFIYKKFKAVYKEIQNEVEGGWWTFALTGLMFYVAITLAMSYPTVITERLEYMPLFIILLILMPVSYINIFKTLRHQHNFYRSQEQENILNVQVSDIKARVEEALAANEKFRTERHDFRHKLQTIARLIEKKEYDDLRLVIAKYGEAIEETKIKRYCDNAVLDAVLSTYIRKAEGAGISVTSIFKFPKSIPVSDVELATVFANAIENAIHACEDVENKYIDIKVISSPRFMLQIENSFDGNIELDDDNIPVSHEEGHGFGTRSIIAFCDKHNAFYEFKIDENKFILRIVF